MKIVGVFWGAWVGMFPEENKKNFEELFKLHRMEKLIQKSLIHLV